MEIRQLRHFIAAVEAGNLRKASEMIHITHPAISMSLKNLEDDLGVRLLDKSRKGVQMTYAGEQFLKSAHSILRQIDDLRSSLLSTDNSPVGSVRIGLPYGVNNALAAPLHQLLLDRYPGISLSIEEGNTTSLERSFEEGLLDLMVNYDTIEKMDQKCEPLYIEHLYFVSAYDEAIDQTDVDSCELENALIVSSPGTHSMRKTIEKYAFDNGIRFNFRTDFQSAHASLKIVVEGMANTIAPWDLIHDHVNCNLVSARKIVSPAMERTACLISSLRETHSPATNAMIDAIKQAVEEARLQDKLRGRAFFESSLKKHV